MKITRREYGDLFICLNHMATTVIKKNVGTKSNPTMVDRTFGSRQIALFTRNKRLLRDTVEEQADAEVAKNEGKTNLTKEAIELTNKQSKSDQEQLRTRVIPLEMQVIDNDYEKFLNEKIELPALEKIPFADIEDYEFSNNDRIQLFWDHIVEFTASAKSNGSDQKKVSKTKSS